MAGPSWTGSRARGSTTSRNELRPPSSGATEVRLLFIFDPERRVVLLVAGDKAGQWSAWYQQAVALAEARYALYRKERQL